MKKGDKVRLIGMAAASEVGAILGHQEAAHYNRMMEQVFRLAGVKIGDEGEVLDTYGSWAEVEFPQQHQPIYTLQRNLEVISEEKEEDKWQKEG